MLKRLIIALVLVGVIALPLLFRRAAGSALTGQDTLVVISPHPESNQAEFKRAFSAWYFSKTGRTVQLDWRYPGGLSDILRILDSLYTNAFRAYWEGTLHHPWTDAIERGYLQNTSTSDTIPSAVREAQRAFRESNVSCGIDIFFGGGAQEFDVQKAKGQFVVPSVVHTHPEWFAESIFPEFVGGFRLRDSDNQWFGVVFSSYGIAYNQDVLKDIKQPIPATWMDLGKPAYFGEIALADPTKSGSTKQAFEMIVHAIMKAHYRELLASGLAPEAAESQAVRSGWIAGMQLIQRMSANTRYFTDKSNRPVLSVASGNCAAGMCLDFAALSQLDNLETRHSQAAFGFVTPHGLAAHTPDAIALLRGAPNPKVAGLFMEFILSSEGQRIWAYKKGTPGGPVEYSLRRLPIRRDFYTDPVNMPYRSDPDIDPYAQTQAFDYRVSWTGPLLPVFHKIIRAAFIDPQDELRAAWAAILQARKDGRIAQADAALAIMQDFSNLDYDTVVGPLKDTFTQRDPLMETRANAQLTQRFIEQYKRAQKKSVQ